MRKNKINDLLDLFAGGSAEIGSVNYLISVWFGGEKEKVESSLSGLQRISVPFHLFSIVPLYYTRSIGLLDEWRITSGFSFYAVFILLISI